MDDFRVHISSGAAEATVFVVGELDAATAPVLDETLRVLEGEGLGGRVVVIDFDGVNFVDSSGLSVLIAAHKRLRAQGTGLVLARPRPSTRRLFAIAGLDAVLTVRDGS